MINILLNGCNGRMGNAVSTLLKTNEEITITAGISPHSEQPQQYPVFKNIYEFKENFDIIVDFSKAESLDILLTYALKKKRPLVIATTGHSPQQLSKIEKASKHIPIFKCVNTSLGVNLMLEIVKKAALVLGTDFDIEIVEKHHNQKIDAPSGTAIIIANAINEAVPEQYDFVYDRHSQKNKRTKKEIGFHSIRGGTYVGEHTIIFAGNDEVLEIKHSALSKNVFAEGVLRIIRFLNGKPSGFYTMKDLIKG